MSSQATITMTTMITGTIHHGTRPGRGSRATLEGGGVTDGGTWGVTRGGGAIATRWPQREQN